MAYSKLSGWSRTLQTSITPEDTTWSYAVPDLPRSDVLNDAGLMKTILVLSNETKQSIDLRFSKTSPNRAIDNGRLDCFISISFEQFRLQLPLPQDHTNGANATKSASHKESADYVVRLLRHGIILNNVQYHFYGHSNSQLKSKTCFLCQGSKAQISIAVEQLGDFSKLKSVAKKAKRIGLLFSAAQMATKLRPDRCQDIPDITKGDYNFTDGCGLISTHLAKLLVQRAHIRYRNRRYTPSVFQIRYRGYKGVLMLEPKLHGQILAQFRDSMRKFKGGDDLSFSVVDCSKPYSFGHLNDEVLLLLSSLGVSEDVLLRKQREHLEFLLSAVNYCENAFRFLSYINKPELAEKVLVDGLESVRATVQKLVGEEYDKMLNKRDEQRCRILIPKSRLLFGVCDSRNILKEGECAVRITTDGDGTPRTISGTEVLVTRNPCLHPGDLQKFRAVQHLELSHLVDCIIFPTRGRRPSADLMSGGDLDGDKFLVCWDPEIIPPNVAEPAHYSAGKEPISFAPVTDDDRLVYFARYTNASLGKVKNLFLDWAKVQGPMSRPCQELNHLFSRCVDGNRIRIPQHLESPVQVEPGTPAFILDVLHKAASNFICSIRLRTDFKNALDGCSGLAIEQILSMDDIAMSEFEIIKLTAQWCSKNNASLADFLCHFDFTQLTDEERAWTLGQIPPTADRPSFIMNAFVGSNLVSEFDLHHFKLDLPGLRWKCVFDSARDRLGRLFEVMETAISQFHKKLLVLRVDTRLTVAIYIPKRVEMHAENIVDDTVRLFAFPPSQEYGNMHRRVVPTKKEYRLYYDSGGLQLFEKKRANTWIFLAKPGMDDSTYRRTEDRGDRRRNKEATMEIGLNHECVASIALNKFSSGLARHIGRINRTAVTAAEIYVISNRDVRSLHVLDQWLQFVDTGEVLPLFEQHEPEYRVPSLKDVNWSAEPEHLQPIVVGDFSWFEPVRSSSEYLTIFHWLLIHEQKGLLRRIFKHLLTTQTDGSRQGPRPVAVRAMIDFLVKAPFLVVAFVELQGWATLPAPVSALLVDSSLRILEAIVLNANTMEDLILEPFKTMLARTPHMSLADVRSLIETISLVVRSPDTAMDLLLGALELESSRVLTARPIVVHYYIRNLIGIAMEHIDEVDESRSVRKDQLKLVLDPRTGLVKSQLRVDAPSTVRMATNDHVRLTVATPPKNSLSSRPYSMDALIEEMEPGCVKFRCLHPIPSFLEETPWKLTNCVPFVNTQAMFEAVTKLVIEPDLCCGIYNQLLGLAHTYTKSSSRESKRPDLNPSQNRAVSAALGSNLTLLWGPPGTGKTYTIAVVLEELLKLSEQDRILVTAPTHNAVDNVLRKFLANMKVNGNISQDQVIRVSTEIRKVADDLREYTCDAMLGKELNENPAARKKAQKKIRGCRLIFTTCSGAGLGLLRSESFDIVIVDEASQQTEPASLIPLVKGCSKGILVGDHVQLRATVKLHAPLQSFDVSLFERLYLAKSQGHGIRKVMLDTQYRMHADICAFSSKEFYEGRLQTAVDSSNRPLAPSLFPWPTTTGGDKARLVFVQCSTGEDLGRVSKTNRGQAELARNICKQLLTPAIAADPKPNWSIAVLTPYAQQVELVRGMVSSGVVVNTIDGFQGREADIVVFVTVRSNLHGKIGFLGDMRRVNVVMTRAKAGCIVIGDGKTLTSAADDKTKEVQELWVRLLGMSKHLVMNKEHTGALEKQE